MNFHEMDATRSAKNGCCLNGEPPGSTDIVHCKMATDVRFERQVPFASIRRGKFHSGWTVGGPREGLANGSVKVWSTCERLRFTSKSVDGTRKNQGKTWKWEIPFPWKLSMSFVGLQSMWKNGWFLCHHFILCSDGYYSTTVRVSFTSLELCNSAHRFWWRGVFTCEWKVGMRFFWGSKLYPLTIESYHCRCNWSVLSWNLLSRGELLGMGNKKNKVQQTNGNGLKTFKTVRCWDVLSWYMSIPAIERTTCTLRCYKSH